jgi:hypothetical protein
LETIDFLLLALLGNSGVLAVNRRKSTAQSIGRTVFDVKSVAGPGFISGIPHSTDWITSRPEV